MEENIADILCDAFYCSSGWDLGRDGKLRNGRNGRSGGLLSVRAWQSHEYDIQVVLICLGIHSCMRVTD